MVVLVIQHRVLCYEWASTSEDLFPLSAGGVVGRCSVPRAERLFMRRNEENLEELAVGGGRSEAVLWLRAWMRGRGSRNEANLGGGVQACEHGFRPQTRRVDRGSRAGERLFGVSRGSAVSEQRQAPVREECAACCGPSPSYVGC